MQLFRRVIFHDQQALRRGLRVLLISTIAALTPSVVVGLLTKGNAAARARAGGPRPRDDLDRNVPCQGIMLELVRRFTGMSGSETSSETAPAGLLGEIQRLRRAPRPDFKPLSRPDRSAPAHNVGRLQQSEE